jgi:hypothetical protein
MAEFQMPEPPEGLFFRVRMSRMLGTPVVKVQLRRKTWCGSTRTSWVFSYIDEGPEDGYESVQDKVTRLAQSLRTDYDNWQAAFERQRLADDLEGDYR